MRVCFWFLLVCTPSKWSRLSTSTAGSDSVFIYPFEEFVSSLLAQGKGAAFFVQPNTGMLGPFETQTVDVTAYTDMWGEYRDHLICKVWFFVMRNNKYFSSQNYFALHDNKNQFYIHRLSLKSNFVQVGDLEPALIPMQMTVKGCPLYFQMTGPQPDDQNQGPTIQSVALSISHTIICTYLIMSLNHFSSIKYLCWFHH